MAVLDVIKTTKELYPGTNIIAILREKTIALQNETARNNILKIEAETEKERIDRWEKEAVPMPAECKIELEKLGLRIPERTGG
jgi:hypothetical protein